MNVTPEDFGGDNPLAGIAFQRALEAAAYQAGQGNYLAPAQRVEDFLVKRPSTGPGRVIPSYRPGVTWTNLWDCLPDFVAASIAEALPILGRKLKGYDQSDAVLTAAVLPRCVCCGITIASPPFRGFTPAARAAAGPGAFSPPPRTGCAVEKRSASFCKV